MNGDRPTEVTALLDRARSPDAYVSPTIAPTLAHVASLDVQHITPDDLCPHDLPDHAAEVAFSLIVLLQLRVIRLQSTSSSTTLNPWEHWRQEEDDAASIEVLEQHIERLWELFAVEYRTVREVEDVLWLAFPESDTSLSRSLRVVDFLYHEAAPKPLVAHPLILFSLIRRWRDGQLPGLHWGSITPQILVERYDILCTPRILHFLGLTSQIIYLCLLANYLLYPPIASIVESHAIFDHGVREMCIIILSLSLAAAQSWTFLAIPPLTAFCSFIFSLRSIPLPGSSAFGFLHIAFALHIFQLHLPIAPSPLFLLSIDKTLPLATLLSQSISTVLIPLSLFFLPLFLIGMLLLSYSLMDTLSSTSTVFCHVPSLMIPPPIETRMAFLLFLMLVFVFFIAALILLSATPQNSNDIGSRSARWDRYSMDVGLKARHALIRAIVAYSTPYAFPPPLNLVQILLFTLPAFAIKSLGIDYAFITSYEKNLWRLLVGPFTAALWIVSWTYSRT